MSLHIFTHTRFFCVLSHSTPSHITLLLTPMFPHTLTLSPFLNLTTVNVLRSKLSFSHANRKLGLVVHLPSLHFMWSLLHPLIFAHSLVTLHSLPTHPQLLLFLCSKSSASLVSRTFFALRDTRNQPLSPSNWETRSSPSFLRTDWLTGSWSTFWMVARSITPGGLVLHYVVHWVLVTSRSH